MTTLNSVRLKNPLPSLTALLANPVVVRDLRAQMRGTKSYWYQGAYLLLLGVLAICGYAQATGQGLWGNDTVRTSIIQAQSRLESFYYFIFLTLAALIVLIAPALTAASIVGERQRQSLDLLVTTPLTAAELLIGKLVSSVAFMGLLLMLSLPASALCVLLGGASIGDIFRIYLLLIVDGLVLAAIGLYFSCAVRTNLLALLWSYAMVGLFLAVTFAVGQISDLGTHEKVTPPLMFICALNPFLAVTPDLGQSVSFGALSMPIWVGALGVAALSLRLLVTASTYRMGVYGGASARSLRWQLLLMLGLGGACLTYSFYAGHGEMWGRDVQALAAANDTLELLLMIFLGMTPLLPALFAPAGPEDTPPGLVEEGGQSDTGWFRPRRAFRAEHAGSLPYFCLALLTTLLGGMAGFRMAGGLLTESVLTMFLGATVYMLGIGFLLWTISRFAASLVRRVSQARALAFSIFLALVIGPILILTITSGQGKGNIDSNPVSIFWLLYPLGKVPESQAGWLILGAVESVVWGLVFILARVARLRRRNLTLSPVE